MSLISNPFPHIILYLLYLFDELHLREMNIKAEGVSISFLVVCRICFVSPFNHDALCDQRELGLGCNIGQEAHRYRFLNMWTSVVAALRIFCNGLKFVSRCMQVLCCEFCAWKSLLIYSDLSLKKKKLDILFPPEIYWFCWNFTLINDHSLNVDWVYFRQSSLRISIAQSFWRVELLIIRWKSEYILWSPCKGSVWWISITFCRMYCFSSVLFPS